MTSIPHVQPAYAPQPAGVPWPTTTWPEGSVANAAALRAVVDEAFTDPDLATTMAVVVVQGGRVVAERYGGQREFFDRPAEPVTAETPLISWSMAKSMLHFVVGTLVDQGRLDPQALAPVPEWAAENDERHDVTLAHLLAMRDGLDFVEDYVPGGVSHVIEMLFGEGKEDMAAYVANRPLAHAPGTFWNYSSGTTNVISRVVADVVGYGDPYRHYLDEHLFGPIGMTTAEPTFDPTGVFIASSYVHAIARDFAKFGLLYLRGGQWDGRQLVSQSWIDTAQQPISVDEESGVFYSWQWWVTGDEYGTYWANGYEGQMIAVVPALDAVVVRLGRTDASKYPELRAWRDRVLRTLAQDAR